MISTGIGILATGGGSNAEALVHYFDGHQAIHVAGVWSNKPNAGVLNRGLDVPCAPMTHGDPEMVDTWKSTGVTALVLAGYLKPIPDEWIDAFDGRVYNIHPALLPNYGGKGMYGMNIHRAVVAAGESESGLTIHEVTTHYDEGPVLFQMRTRIDELSADEVAAKILKGEHWAFPRVIEAALMKREMPSKLPEGWLK